MMERALIAEKRLSEALKLAESNGKLAHDAAIQLRETQRECDRLAEALSFYADSAKYPVPYTGGMGSLYFDCGGVAKRALDQIKNSTP